MSFLLALTKIYVPGFIRKSRLIELFRATADAFQVELPNLKGNSFDRCLTEYALFTRKKAEEAIRRGNQHEVKERLYYNALHIGKTIKEQLNIRTMEEVMQACRVIYKALKIDFRGDLQGQVHIRSCFFSTCYSGDVCRIISGLDEGLIAGLSGGQGLEFTQRITEGNDCCKAHLTGAGASN